MTIRWLHVKPLTNSRGKYQQSFDLEYSLVSQYVCEKYGWINPNSTATPTPAYENHVTNEQLVQYQY